MMIRPSLILSALLLAVSLTGCGAMQANLNEHLIHKRNHYDSWVAWRCNRPNYVDCQEYLFHFGKGFRAGYRNIAEGGNGCPPMLPPRDYWGPCYDSAEGQKKVVSWFDGHQHGVAAAAMNGLEGSGRIMTSNQLYQKCSADIELPISGNHSADHGLSPSQQPQLVPTITPQPSLVPAPPSLPQNGNGAPGQLPSSSPYAPGLNRQP